MYTIGIDPGTQGAYCILRDDKIQFCEKLPFVREKITTISQKETKKETINRIDIDDMLFTFLAHDLPRSTKVFIEKPFVKSTEGGSSTSWGNFDRLLQIALKQFDDVTIVTNASVWQKALQIVVVKSESKGLTPKQKKALVKSKSVDFAIENNPEQDFYRKTKIKQDKTDDIDDNLTDAANIALFGYLYKSISKL
jgi:hypothetical protein